MCTCTCTNIHLCSFSHHDVFHNVSVCVHVALLAELTNTRIA